MARQGLLVAHETVPSNAGGPPRIEYELTDQGDHEYLELLRDALADREPSLDVLAAAVGLIEDLPRDEALRMLRTRADTLQAWRSSITGHLPPDTDLDTWGPVGEVLSLWLSTADFHAQWTVDSSAAWRRERSRWRARRHDRPRRSSSPRPTTPKEDLLANEIMVPLLPCRSIDEIAEFYGMLGFTQTYYQAKPYPCIGLRRDDIQMQFFGLPDFKPEDSYGSCLVIVPDTGEVYRSFAASMRAAHGKVLVSGIPRMTRPRKRKNADDRSGFSVIDPGGNWIRFFAATIDRDEPDPARGKLGALLQNAIVMGDSKGDHLRAATILDDAIARNGTTASATDLVEALAYRADLALRADDTAAASSAIARAREITLSDAERVELAETLAGLDDIAAQATSS